MVRLRVSRYHALFVALVD